MEWLDDYRMRLMLVGFVAACVLGARIARADFTFGEPMNLGPTVNSSADEFDPGISSDGLELYFHSARPGGYGPLDIWVTRRSTTKDEWGETVNIGQAVNSSSYDECPFISPDGLTLYFNSYRPGGYGNFDLWVTTRPTKEDPWGPPENLGPIINTSGGEAHPYISADGLSLYFAGAAGPMDTPRNGGYGGGDIWLTTRITKTDEWSPPQNLGATINSSVYDAAPCISADGLMLFFHSERPGGYGTHDIWVARRKTPDDTWEEPFNLGPPVNSSYGAGGPALSGDGKTLYFISGRPGGSGAWDLWQSSIIPIVDFNGDGIVDAEDMCIMVDHWGTDEPLCDIGPMPWGDGIVDVQDLVVLAEHLFEELPPVE